MNKTALDQYEEIVTDALKSCSAKLRKSFKTAFIQLMILYMVLPRKINFTQMGRYSDSSEQRFRQLFEREFDRMQFNLFLMRQQFGESARKAIAFDASYISKSGKKTPYIGKFWSGCASAMKRGLEILGIGIVDIDSRDCMMLCAEQTPDKAYLEKQGEEYNLVDWYLDVLRKYRDKLLDITRYIVADAWFSKAKFVGKACLPGFHVISRLRDDEFYPADVHAALADDVRRLVYTLVKAFAESRREVVYQRLSAAVSRVFHRVRCRVFRHVGQESAACRVVSYKHAFYLEVFQIFLKFGVVVEKAWRLYHRGFAVFLYDEYFVVDGVVSLVCVQLYCAEVIYVYFAFCELYCFKCVFVHGLIPPEKYLCFRKTCAPDLFCDLILTHFRNAVK